MGSSSFSDTGWAGYFEITSDNTVVDEAIGDVLYRLDNAPASFWSEVKSDGGDIRVTDSDGTTAYSLEVGGDFDSTAETGTIYFDSALLQTGADVSWRVYAGKSDATQADATATLGRNNVWQDGEQLVMHHEESPTGTIIDSAGNHDGTSAGSMTSGDLVAGAIGNGLDFDGSNDYYSIGDNLDVDPSSESLTISCWFTTTQISGPTFVGILGKRDGHNTSITGYNIVLSPSNGGIRFEVTDGSDLAGEGAAGVNANDGDPHYIVAIINNAANEIRVYFDAGDEGADDLTGVGDVANSDNFVVGAIADGSDNFDGVIDEVRVYDNALSANAVATIYENQRPTSNTFWTTGTWVANGVTENLAGTSAWTSDSTATLSSDVPLGSTSTWSSDSTATLFSSIPLAGTSLWTSDTAATLSTDVPLTATSVWTSDSTANLTCNKALTATSAWTSDSTANLTTNVPLAGTSSGSSDSTAALTITVSLDGTCSATSGTSSLLSKFVGLSATSSGSSDTTASLSITAGVSADCQWSFDSTAVLTCDVPLTATSAWIFGNSAELSKTSPATAGDGRGANLDRRDIAAMLNGSPSAACLDVHSIAAKLSARAIASKAHKRSVAAVTIQN